MKLHLRPPTNPTGSRHARIGLRGWRGTAIRRWLSWLGATGALAAALVVTFSLPAWQFPAGAGAESQVRSTWAATQASVPLREVRWQGEDLEIDDTYQTEDARLAAMSEEELQVEYRRQLDQWRFQFSRLMQAHTAFYSMPKRESDDWDYQFRDAKRQGEKARIAAGHVAAHLLEKTTGRPDPGLAEMAYHMIDSHLFFHQYQMAHRLANALLGTGYERPHLYAMAAYSAFCVNRFDEAQQLFGRAIIAGDHLPDHFARAFEQCSAASQRMEREMEALATDAGADLPRVELTTTKGKIVVELFEDQAPNTVANFIYLVEQRFYRNQQFYDTTDSLISTGSPTNDPEGWADYWIASEADRTDRRLHLRGYLTLMVVPELQAGSSQFAILTKPRPDLDSMPNTVFGRIVEGEIVLDLLERAGEEWEKAILAPDSQIGEPDQILGARVLRKRNRDYYPQRLGVDLP